MRSSVFCLFWASILAVVLTPAPLRAQAPQGPLPDAHIGDYVQIGLDPLAFPEPVTGSAVYALLVRVSGEPPAPPAPPAPPCPPDTEDCPPAPPAPPAPPRPPLGVEWSTTSFGSSTEGSSCESSLTDFVPLSGRFRVGTDDRAIGGEVAVHLCSDDLIEGPETFALTLAITNLESPGQRMMERFIVTVSDSTSEADLMTINGVHGSLQFHEPSYVDLKVFLTERDNVEPVRIRYSTESVPGSAVDREDYQSYSGETDVGVGEPGAIVRAARILDDDHPEPLEVFIVWVEVVGMPWTRQSVLIEILDAEGDRHAPGFLTVAFGDSTMLDVVEGDVPGAPIPVILSLSDLELRSTELDFRIRTVDGTAVGGQDFVPIDEKLTFRRGELVLYDIDRPLQFHLLPDLTPEEPVEYLYLAIYATFVDSGIQYFSELHRVTIQDDDFVPAVVDGASLLWIGPNGPGLCPVRSLIVDLPEPDPDVSPFVDYRLDLYARLEPLAAVAPAEPGAEAPPVQCAPLQQTFATSVALFSGGAAGYPTASVGFGQDLSLVGEADPSIVFTPVEHQAVMTVRVYADSSLEADEQATVRFTAGVHGALSFHLRVLDFQKTQAQEAGRAASFVRVGRLLGALVTDALADRFSCSRTTGCGASPPQAGGSVDGLFRRLAGSFGTPLAQTGVAGGVTGFGHRPRPRRSVLESVGHAVDGVSYAGSPSAWFRVRNAQSGSVWSAWVRTDYISSRFQSVTGGSLTTSVVGMLGGLDRRVGIFHVGTLYGWVWADYGRPFGETLASVEGVEAQTPLFTNQMRWQVLSPYVAVTPHSRVRGWTSFGRTFLGAWNPDPVYQPPVDGRVQSAPSYGMLTGGGSFTALQTGWLLVDLEADVFRVAVSARDSGDSTPGASSLGSAHRRRVALRLGFPLGVQGSSRLALALSRRWDEGPDIVWVNGADGVLEAYDVGFDLRLSGHTSRVSASLSGRMEVLSPHLSDGRGGRSRERTVGGVLRWGAVETASGWAVSLRPSYGYTGLLSSLQRGTMGSVLPGAAPFVDAHPSLDLDAGYRFADGSRFGLRGGRTFGPAALFGSGLTAQVNFERGW